MKTSETSAAAAVMARPQRKKADFPIKALNVPKHSCETEVDMNEFKAIQER